MRHRSALTLIAASLLLGSAAVPGFAEGTPAQQNAQPAPENGSNPSAQPTQDPNRKTSGTVDQSGPSNAAPTANQDAQGDKATHSVSGRGGKEEPGSHAPSQAHGEAAVLLNGAWNVPGAPADSQTVPAKFSQRNAAIDDVPIMAMPVLGLSDAQKKAIAESVKRADVPVQSTAAKAAEELPWQVTVHDLGISSQDPALARMKYVRAKDRILLVDAPNRIVIGEIKTE
jgi:hypothetical protein